MKLLLHTTRIFLLLLITLNSCYSAQLTFDRLEAKIDLKPGEEQARAKFIVTNEGKETVRIARVKTSCGCTGSILNRKILESGQSTEIVATFNKGKRRGLNTNRLEVFVDSQPDPIATLRMTVQIPELITARPEVIYWNANAAKSPRFVKITLDKRYVETISDILYDKNLLTIKDKPDAEGKADLVLEIQPKSFEQALRQTITVKCNGKDGISNELRIHVFVQP